MTLGYNVRAGMQVRATGVTAFKNALSKAESCFVLGLSTHNLKIVDGILKKSNKHSATNEANYACQKINEPSHGKRTQYLNNRIFDAINTAHQKK